MRAAHGRAARAQRNVETSAENDEAETARRPDASGRGIWSGSISFGLLQIPVTLYTAERRAEELHFRLLDKRDLSPIRYERVSSATGKPVEWKDIVKGFEYEKDTFVVVEPDDLEKANVKATQTIDIQDFVHADQIDPAFFETPYYVVPQKRAQKAYVLLREALEKKNAVAIATFVLRTREHLVALMPVGDAIMLEVLRFGHELKPPEGHAPALREGHGDRRSRARDGRAAHRGHDDRLGADQVPATATTRRDEDHRGEGADRRRTAHTAEDARRGRTRTWSTCSTS